MLTIKVIIHLFLKGFLRFNVNIVNAINKSNNNNNNNNNNIIIIIIIIIINVSKYRNSTTQ